LRDKHVRIEPHTPAYLEARERLLHVIAQRQRWAVLCAPHDDQRAALLADVGRQSTAPLRCVVRMDVAGLDAAAWLHRFSEELGLSTVNSQSPLALWRRLTDWYYAADAAGLEPVCLFDRFDVAAEDCRRHIRRLSHLAGGPTVIVAVSATRGVEDADGLRIELPAAAA
jgi:hypothetical protein